MTQMPTIPGWPDGGWPSPLDALLGPSFPTLGSAAAGSQIEPADPLIGTPGADAQAWSGQQGYADTCAIRCQEYILEQFTGTPFSEAALVQEAMAAGWYTPGEGTSVQDVGNLLEQHGIPVNRYEGATIFHLANELAQGHKVIVGVDSGELWGQHPTLESIADSLGIAGADHAVVVSGIDTRDPDQVQVVVSDPGTGEAAAIYPLDQFVDAWRDSGCHMVATQDPAPPTAPGMEGFDYGLGHVATVWDLPYEEFAGLADQPDTWDQALDDALDQGDDRHTAPGPDASAAWPEDLHGSDQDEIVASDHQDLSGFDDDHHHASEPL